MANALWDNADPVMNNASGPDTPLDWVYLFLPELENRQALESFKSKWLSHDSEDQDTASTYSSDMIKEVGAAVTGLRHQGCSLDLSIPEEQLIAAHIERLVEMIASDSVSFNSSIGSAIESLGPLVAEIAIPGQIAENLFDKTRLLLSTQGAPRTLRAIS